MRCLAVCHTELVIQLLEAVLTPNAELDVLVESRALARKFEHAELSVSVDEVDRIDSYVKIGVSPVMPVFVEDNGRKGLRKILEAVRDAGHPVVWACDPMHANTTTSTTGRKTRSFDAICAEIDGFVRAHHAEGTWPGGIHVELTGENVTECTGGVDNISELQLDEAYQTVCDPRLNGRQGIDLAFRVAELIRSNLN